jgi:23S rRNA (pseudouridine1915-N3)-methyltransferase
MHIQIVSVGKLKESYLVQGIAEYVKRLGPYARVTLIEVSDEKAPEVLSAAEERQVVGREGERILSQIKDEAHVIALAIGGELWSSEELAGHLDKLGTYGKSHVAFIIGGSLGLSDAVLRRADKRLSFGRLTYPHQLMRLILVEQIYRAFRINRGEPYHK